MLSHLAEFSSFLRLNMPYCTYLPICQRTLELLPPFFIVNNALMIIGVFIQVHTFNSFGYLPRSGIARSHDNSIFNFLRSHYTVSQSYYTALRPHQPCARAPAALHPCQYLLSPGAFDSRHPSGCEVVSQGGFDLHFP